jgi:hypothetical protein
MRPELRRRVSIGAAVAACVVVGVVALAAAGPGFVGRPAGAGAAGTSGTHPAGSGGGSGGAGAAASNGGAGASAGVGGGPVGASGGVSSTSVTTARPLGPGAGVAASAGPAIDAVSDPAAFRAPALRRPLINLDPSLALRGPRPTLRLLMQYQYGDPPFIVRPGATDADWQLSRPNPRAVSGYADRISVLPGQMLGLHLAGIDRSARLDVFRIGIHDANRVLDIPSVRVGIPMAAAPRPSDGLVEESWPVTAQIPVGADWRSGVYLIKVTGASGGQSYIPFIVRETTPQPFTVVLPTMTWEAYNDYGGSDLYGWYGGPQPRAYRVSYDRPFRREAGAGLFFRLDFPLIVWLEDHGYQPGYVADVDLAQDPSLTQGTHTIVFSGHSEYWTGSLRDTMESAAAAGVNLGFFGANQGFWQVRLERDAAGGAGRVVACYKSAALDPLAVEAPADATVRFQDPPVNRPPSTLMGLEYGGVVNGISSMVVGAGISTFDPASGLRAGQTLPGLVADEIDSPPQGFTGLVVGATPITVTEHPGVVTSAAALWVGRAGNHVFDAGTFDFSWGLDPRYSAALPGFAADGYSHLTASILAWLGAQPTL